MKLSVIIPAYIEPYLQRTVDSLLENSDLGGDLEVFVVLDGPRAGIRPVANDPRLKVLELGMHQGMRACFNAGLSFVSGKYIMKADAHCAFGPAFDRIMVEDCEENMVMVPRRYALDEATWGPDKKKMGRDYHYLNYPVPAGDAYECSMTPHFWGVRGNSIVIDEIMTYQGSCWMADYEYFMRLAGPLDDHPSTYGPFWGEQLEVGLKYWLGGGRVVVNKAAWYAHLFKQPRHYDSGDFEREDKGSCMINRHWSTRHWLHDLEPNMIHPFSWLVEKFWPVPTWPADRKEWK